MTTVARVADDYLAALAELDPAAAHLVGADSPRPLPDWSPTGIVARRDLDAATATRVRAATPSDGADRRLAAVMAERLEADVALFDVGFTPRLLAPLATPLHRVRDLLETLDAADPDRAEDLLMGLPGAIADHRASLAWARAQGHVAPRHTIEVAADQVSDWLDDGPGGLIGPVAQRLARRDDLPDSVTDRMHRIARELDTTVLWLRNSLWPSAPSRWACGDEFHAVTTRAFLGTAVDHTEVAAWGHDQVQSMRRRALRLADELGPGTGLAEVCDRLDHTHTTASTALPDWLASRVALATERLAAAGWPLPDGIHEVRCRVSGAVGDVMFYGPAEGDGQPATVWWNRPVDGSSAPTWRQATTIHHEAVPGHHLQISTARHAALHPWQAHLCHVHGYAEGWAHHAERLADDLGLLVDPAERLGMVLGQLHRAARIVADTSLHLDRAPGRDVGWTVERAVDYLVDVAMVDRRTARFEVDRYLAWPGQALAFRLGARVFDRIERLLGEQDTPAPEAWAALLRRGPMGLDLLTEQATTVTPPPRGTP